MIKIIFGLICIIFMIFGIVDIVKFILLSTMKIPKNSVNPAMVIPIHGHHSDIEQIIRGIINQLKWMNNHNKTRVICLDCGMDSETKRICEILCSEYSCLEIQKSVLDKQG